MIFHIFFFLAMLLHVNADLTNTVGSSTLSSVKCVTKLATTSAKTAIKTTKSTTTLLPEIIRILSTSTPVKTVTGPPSTVTSTVPVTTTVTTTNAAVTGTFSTTTTVVSVSTIVSGVTIFSTEIVASTVSSTTTVVIPTPQDFINIYDSSGEQNPGEQNRAGQNPKQRGLLRARNLLSDRRALSNRYKYPLAVRCINYVRVRYIKKIVVVKPTVTKISPGPTSTVRTTVTRTSTSTVIAPGVSSTITFSTTSIRTTTVLTTFVSTTTSTQTETLVNSTTSYAACATKNLLGPRVNTGNYLTTFNIRDASVSYNEKPDIPSAYDCCAACQTGTNCQFSVYFTGSRQSCLNIETADSCQAQPFNAGSFRLSAEQQNFTSVYSNGPCGQLVSQGLEEP